MNLELEVDDDRLVNEDGTGIYVRAKNSDGAWGSYDIAQLNAYSLLAWLRSDGEKNRIAENTIGILFGHGALDTDDR